MKRQLVVLLVSLGAAVVAGISPVAPGPAAAVVGVDGAVADHVVQVGAIGPAGRPYSYTRFYPSTIQVHRGQTVEWRLPTGPNSADTQFHTVTFSGPDDEAQPGWFRPDEAAGTFAFNEAILMGTGCGRGDEPSCVLRSDTGFFSSGSEADAAWRNADGTIKPFRVTVDAPAGSYTYRCLIHDGMTGTVDVVDDGAPVDNPTPAEVAAEVAADTASADALYEAESEQQPPVVENGRRIWTVKVGARTPDRHVDVLAYFPGTATIAPGDEIRYLAMEPHTVTFPAAVVGPRLGPTPVPFGSGAGAFLPACDPDDPAGGLPGALLFPVVASCPAGTAFEVLMAPWMTGEQRAPADAVATTATIHNSGLLVPPGAPEYQRGLPKGSGHHLPSAFRAVFPAEGDYAMGCSLHPNIGMSGGVAVR